MKKGNPGMEIPVSANLPIDVVARSSNEKKPFYKSLSFQVLVAITIAIFARVF